VRKRRETERDIDEEKERKRERQRGRHRGEGERIESTFSYSSLSLSRLLSDRLFDNKTDAHLDYHNIPSVSALLLRLLLLHSSLFIPLHSSSLLLCSLTFPPLRSSSLLTLTPSTGCVLPSSSWCCGNDRGSGEEEAWR